MRGESWERGNWGACGGDYQIMDCSQMRGAISADLDGEELPVTREALDRHLAACPACREYQAAAVVLNRRVRVSAAPRVPNLTGPILAAIDAEGHEPAAAQGLRLGVAVLGLLARFSHLPLPPGLHVLAGWPVIAASLALFALEFFAESRGEVIRTDREIGGR